MSLHTSLQRGNGVELLDFALAYAARGWSIIPTKAKLPACRWKSFQQERPDDETLRRLFAKKDITGLAVVLGLVSGELACRDYDDLASYQRWALSQPQLASTLPTVETRRGRHVYFRGTAGFTKFTDGEYRGRVGQYTILPPSLHPAGSAYRWLIPLPVGPLPLVDPSQAGLCNREDTGNGEDTENGEHIANPASLELAAPSLLQAIDQAIGATLPALQGQRRGNLFQLARRLKAIPSFASSEVTALRPIILKWHQLAFPIIGTKPFVETWADFIQAWKRVKFPYGEGPMDAAFKRAASSIPPPHVSKLYGAEGPIVVLAILCRELQRIIGTGEFFLDCRTAARFIGVDHTTAWRYLEVLCADGILAPGAKGSQETRKASRFRYLDIEQGEKRQ